MEINDQPPNHTDSSKIQKEDAHRATARGPAFRRDVPLGRQTLKLSRSNVKSIEIYRRQEQLAPCSTISKTIENDNRDSPGAPRNNQSRSLAANTRPERSKGK